jgi:DNA-binding PadR family transcriptional regulator
MSDARDIGEGWGLWELAVLAVLRERPMHPYEIQKRLKARRKDEVLVLKRGSLYHAIRRLSDAGLIEVVETSREGARPERTTYRLRPEGEARLLDWLRARVATVKREANDFTGTLNFLVHLTPADAAERLARRIAALEAEVDAIARQNEGMPAYVGRINLIETEYLLAMRQAELAWVRRLYDDIAAGRLAWDIDLIMKVLGGQ